MLKMTSDCAIFSKLRFPKENVLSFLNLITDQIYYVSEYGQNQSEEAILFCSIPIEFYTN